MYIITFNSDESYASLMLSWVRAHTEYDSWSLEAYRDGGSFENLGGRASSNVVHSVRGQSGFFNLVLTERNMQVKYDLKLSVYSLDLEI